jgi:hypothetical protein
MEVGAEEEQAQTQARSMSVLVNNAGRIHFIPIVDDDLGGDGDGDGDGGGSGVRGLFETNV